MWKSWRSASLVRSCPRNCERQAEGQYVTGASPGRRPDATTREPGDLPSQVLDRRRVSGVFAGRKEGKRRFALHP